MNEDAGDSGFPDRGPSIGVERRLTDSVSVGRQ